MVEKGAKKKIILFYNLKKIANENLRFFLSFLSEMKPVAKEKRAEVSFNVLWTHNGADELKFIKPKKTPHHFF